MEASSSLIPQPQLERQRTLDLHIPQSVAIIGCGGVGAWVAVFLALAGVHTLYLWDGDEVSETNLNRLPLGPYYLNQNKALSLKHHLNQLCPSCDIIAMAENWSPASQADFPVPAWIVAATDSWRSRVMIHEWSQQVNHGELEVVSASGHINYIECSAEGEYGGCTESPAMFTTDLEDHPGYASVPVHVGPAVSSAVMVTYNILHSIAGTYNLRFGWNSDSHRLELQHL